LHNEQLPKHSKFRIYHYDWPDNGEHAAIGAAIETPDIGEAGSSAGWHAVAADEALRLLGSAPDGLSQAEAESRLSRYGKNRLPRPDRPSFIRRFFLQFHNLLIYVLIGAAVLAALLDHALDAVVIIAVVIINAVIGVVQEGRAEKALEAVSRLIEPVTSVIRDGNRLTIAAEDVVPGDIVQLEAGDRLPADLRIFRQRGLTIDEALLTGESVTASKHTAPVAPVCALGDRSCMAFSGTMVTAGQGAGVAVTTGLKTELGKVSAMLANVETLQTPLLKQMDHFARQQAFIVLSVALIMLGLMAAFGSRPLAEVVMIVVSLSVAAIPEGLPAVMTITLAIGVQRMAGRNAIIRRLPAVETLGAVSVICTDKTGTLTHNEMIAQSLALSGCDYDVSGTGYAPHGHFECEGEVEQPAEHALELARAVALCNDAALRDEKVDGDVVWVADGDPMEAALLALAMKAGVDPADQAHMMPRIDAIPFDATYRFMATLHHCPDGSGLISVKGAPEQLLSMCSTELDKGGKLSPFSVDSWLRRADGMAAQGQRVLAIATRRQAVATEELSFVDVEQGLTLLGLVGFIDPPREEALAAVAACHDAGIHVVMITGDHAVTAREIARQLGLADDPHVMTGQDLDQLDDEVLQQVVMDTTVFARTNPEHKLRLVKAMQEQGLTVAMTGDGVNDAPALKRADIGIAMGRKGTEAAKQASAMVLADDNFASIVAAVREGRTVYDNLRKVIACMLPTNGGEALTIIVALLMGYALPVTPVQILWINMVTAVALDITLAFEPTEAGTMRRPPRRRNEALISRLLLWRILFVSLVMVACAFGVFFHVLARGEDLALARTMVVNVIVMLEITFLFSVRYVYGSGLNWRGLVGTKAVLIGVSAVVAVQFLFTYTPWLQELFDSRALTSPYVLLIVAIGAGSILVFEAEKALTLKWLERRRLV